MHQPDELEKNIGRSLQHIPVQLFLVRRDLDTSIDIKQKNKDKFSMFIEYILFDIYQEDQDLPLR